MLHYGPRRVGDSKRGATPSRWLLEPGRVDDVLPSLQPLRVDGIPRQKWPHQTIDDLERHREENPCDALRQALGLRQFSNGGKGEWSLWGRPHKNIRG